MGYCKLNVAEVRKYCEDIYKNHGFTEDEARGITDVVLCADLYGIESHGVQRMIRYHNSIVGGHVDPKARMEIVFETPVSAVIEANRTMAGDEDMIGFSSTNTEAIAIPTFGKKAMLGTSPLAVCMPADPYYFWFDAATTVIPRGKVEVYNKRGEPLHEGWAADETGHISTDAGHVLDLINAKDFGGIFPLGGMTKDTGSHKGYGFGIIAELFTGILAGGHTSPHVENGGMGDTSFGFAAIDYGIFGDKKEIRANMSTLLRELRESPTADGQERVYTPGEQAMLSQADRLANGIPVNDKTVDELKMIGEYVGLNFDDYIRDIRQI